jgi:hypothetical protein
MNEAFPYPEKLGYHLTDNAFLLQLKLFGSFLDALEIILYENQASHYSLQEILVNGRTFVV